MVAENVYQRINPKTGKPVPGSYEFIFRDSTHRQVWRTATGTTKKEAVAERTALVASMSAGKRIERSKLTVGEVADLWLARATGARGPWGETTKERKDRIVRQTIDQTVGGHGRPLGKVKLRDLTVDRVAEWSRTNEEVLAKSTAKLALGSLNQVCRFAVRKGWLAENVVALLEPGERPQWESASIAILESNDLRNVLDNARSYRPIFELLAYTGLRIGECLGLRWRDVDFAHGVLRVRQQLGRDCKPRRLKTKAAQREIILGAPLIALLHDQQHDHPGAPDDYVFRNHRGNPYLHQNVGTGFRAAVRRAGIDTTDRLTVHSFRHFYASMLISAGLNVAFVSRQLGHTKSSTTLAIYAHLFSAAEHADTARAAIEAHHQTLNPVAPNSNVVTAVVTNGPPPARHW